MQPPAAPDPILHNQNF